MALKDPSKMVRLFRAPFKNKQNYDILALGIAGWILFCSGKDQHGKDLQISDPLQDTYKSIYQDNNQYKDIVNSFLSLKVYFQIRLLQIKLT